MEEETYRFGNTVFSYNTNELRTASSKVLITSRQADILRLLALNVNQAVSRDHLLEAVWGTVSYATGEYSKVIEWNDFATYRGGRGRSGGPS